MRLRPRRVSSFRDPSSAASRIHAAFVKRQEADVMRQQARAMKAVFGLDRWGGKSVDLSKARICRLIGEDRAWHALCRPGTTVSTPRRSPFLTDATPVYTPPGAACACQRHHSHDSSVNCACGGHAEPATSIDRTSDRLCAPHFCIRRQREHNNASCVDFAAR
jgi:hypothetical protein